MICMYRILNEIRRVIKIYTYNYEIYMIFIVHLILNECIRTQNKVCQVTFPLTISWNWYGTLRGESDSHLIYFFHCMYLIEVTCGCIIPFLKLPAITNKKIDSLDKFDLYYIRKLILEKVSFIFSCYLKICWKKDIHTYYIYNLNFFQIWM